MIRVLHQEPSFSELFVSYLLARNARIQADLVDQLFNSSEKRLARASCCLPSLARTAHPEKVIPKISQGTSGSNDRYDAFPRKLLYESLPQVGINPI